MRYQKSLHWTEHCFMINGKPDFLVSGEFHYFRVPKKKWRERLELFRETKGNCIATYIPWGLHEPQEGDFLFGDSEERDLEGFLQLCAELDLFVVCRPGPYSYSELRYDGLPKWLCENYPELRAQNRAGECFRISSISYLHPLFLEKAGCYLNTVCHLLSKYTLPNGPVALIQLDNELLGIHTWFGTLDYHPDMLELGKQNGRTSIFLQNKYHTISKLNAAWNTSFSSFSDVSFPNIEDNNNICSLRIAKDFLDLTCGMSGEYMKWIAKIVKNNGIDCPLIHNSANPSMNSLFRETCDIMGNEFLLGSDHYYNLNQEWAQNNPTPQYAIKVLYSLSILGQWGFPPTVMELPAGSCSDWPPITPLDLECCYRLHLALGMKGLNYYIFTGGPNPTGLGQFGNDYDYCAPVGIDGTLRQSYKTLKNFGTLLSSNVWLAQSERIVDLYVGIPNEYARSHLYDQDMNIFQYCNHQAFSLALQGMLPSLLCASYSPGILDLEQQLPENALDHPLVVPSSPSMARTVQQRLIEFLKKGGKLLLAPVIPYMDEDFFPCTILRDFLQSIPEQPFSDISETEVCGVKNVLYRQLWGTEKIPPNAMWLGTEKRSGRCISWLQHTEGNGKCIWLGVDWLYSRNEQRTMFKMLLNDLEYTSPIVFCDNPNIWTSMLSDGTHQMLFMINLFSSPMEAVIRIKNGIEKYKDLGKIKIPGMSVEIKIIK